MLAGKLLQSNRCGLQHEKANPSKDWSTFLQTDVHYVSEKFIILHNFWVVLTKGNSFQVTWVNSLLKIHLLVFSFVLLPKSIINNKRKKVPFIYSQCQQVSLFHLNIKSKEKLNLTNRKNRCGSQTPLKGYVFTVVVSGKLG